MLWRSTTSFIRCRSTYCSQVRSGPNSHHPAEVPSFNAARRAHCPFEYLLSGPESDSVSLDQQHRICDGASPLKRSNMKQKSRRRAFGLVLHRAIVISFCGLLTAHYALSSLKPKQPPTKKVEIYSGDYPVLDEHDRNRFSNTPVSRFRPQNQFSVAEEAERTSFSSWSSFQHPILSIITVTKNPTPTFYETVSFVKQQSLRPVAWIIINDYSDSPESIQLLKTASQSDNRVTLLDNPNRPGYTSGKIAALKHLLKHPTPYFAFLDDDDMLELTAYEKCVWMLESNENSITMCGSHVVGFGEKDYSLDRGYHNDDSVHLYEFPFTGGEVLRTDLLQTTNCTYDVQFDGEFATWDFYLCLARHRKWGATIPEELFWHREHSLEVRKKRWSAIINQSNWFRHLVQHKHKPLNHSFPEIVPRPSKVFETIPIRLPFENHLHVEQGVLFIVSEMTNGYGTIGNLNLVRELSKRGYRVTVACTRVSRNDVPMKLRSRFMQYTHDVFFLPRILRVVDVPRFLSYIIESRNTELVLIAGSRMGYGILPWLAAKYDKVRFIDYVLDDFAAAQPSGCNSLSAVHQESLDATFISSKTSARMMSYEKCPRSSVPSIYVEYSGMDMQHLDPFSEAERLEIREKYGISTTAIVIVHVCEQIQQNPTLIPLDAFVKITKNEQNMNGRGRTASQYTFVVIGDGPQLEALEKYDTNNVRLFKDLDHGSITQLIGTSDIYSTSSTREGISYSLAKAMALEVTPLVSDIGWNSELLGWKSETGILVPVTGEHDRDVIAFAEKMKTLVQNKDIRKTMGVKARHRIHAMFSSSRNTPILVDRILNHPKTRESVIAKEDDLSPLYYTQERILDEARESSDFLETQRWVHTKTRSGYGERYQIRCGEETETTSRLIDYLEEAKSCEEGARIDGEELRGNAIAQCHQWCIMDLSDSKRISGWRADERCDGFYKFNGEDDKCVLSYRRRTDAG